MMAFVKDGNLDLHGLEEAVRIATRIGLRQTNVTLDLDEWDIVQKRDRLVGVSLSGIMDFESALDWTNTKRDYILDMIDVDSTPKSISHPLAQLLKHLNGVSNKEALQYAKEMRIPAPLLTNTIKPSGTISKLPMISSGAHMSRAPYFIRRVRITATDPLAKVMLDAGFRVYPETATTGMSDERFNKLSQFERIAVLQQAKTWVIEFPVKTSAKLRSADESAIDQLGRYLDLQKYWTDHNTSITIEFAPDEVDELVDMLLENWDDYVAVSFMPKDTNAYPQLPEEVITEEEYLRRAKEIEHISAHAIVEALKELERENMMSDLLDADCVGGACPVR